MADNDYLSLATSLIPAAVGLAFGGRNRGVAAAYGAASGLSDYGDRQLATQKMNADIAFKNNAQAMQQYNQQRQIEMEQQRNDLQKLDAVPKIFQVGQHLADNLSDEDKAKVLPQFTKLVNDAGIKMPEEMVSGLLSNSSQMQYLSTVYGDITQNLPPADKLKFATLLKAHPDQAQKLISQYAFTQAQQIKQAGGDIPAGLNAHLTDDQRLQLGLPTKALLEKQAEQKLGLLGGDTKEKDRNDVYAQATYNKKFVELNPVQQKQILQQRTNDEKTAPAISIVNAGATARGAETRKNIDYRLTATGDAPIKPKDAPLWVDSGGNNIDTKELIGKKPSDIIEKYGDAVPLMNAQESNQLRSAKSLIHIKDMIAPELPKILAQYGGNNLSDILSVQGNRLVVNLKGKSGDPNLSRLNALLTDFLVETPIAMGMAAGREGPELLKRYESGMPGMGSTVQSALSAMNANIDSVRSRWLYRNIDILKGKNGGSPASSAGGQAPKNTITIGGKTYPVTVEP